MENWWVLENVRLKLATHGLAEIHGKEFGSGGQKLCVLKKLRRFMLFYAWLPSQREPAYMWGIGKTDRSRAGAAEKAGMVIPLVQNMNRYRSLKVKGLYAAVKRNRSHWRQWKVTAMKSIRRLTPSVSYDRILVVQNVTGYVDQEKRVKKDTGLNMMRAIHLVKWLHPQKDGLEK